MRRFGAWVAILLLTVYLVFVGGAWYGIYSTDLRLVSAVLLSAVFATWFLVAWRNPEWRPRSRFSAVIVLAIGSMAASTITSRFPRQSVEYLAYAVVLAGLYLLLVRILANPFFRARIGALTVILTLVIGGAFAILCFAHWIKWWGLVGHLAVPPLRPESESLTFGNPSAVLTIVLLFWCSAAAVIGFDTVAKRSAVAGLGLLAIFAIVVSGSRSGWFAVAVACAAIAVIWLSRPEGRRRASTAISNVLATSRGRLAFGALAVVAVGLGVVLGPVIVRRLTDSGAGLRVGYLLAAFRMFIEAPVLGTGPGTWVIQRVRYTFAPETDYYIPHAHDIYAQTLAELGVIGLIVGAFIAIQVARLVWGGMHEANLIRRRLGWAAAFGLIYFSAHQLLDFYPNMPAALFAAAFPVAWLDATASSESGRALHRIPEVPPRLAAAWRAVAVVAVAVACAGLTWTEGGASAHSLAATSYDRGEWAVADDAARRALEMDPWWPPYDFTAGLAAAAAGDHQRAADAFRRAATADDLPASWLDLAAEELLLDHRDAALAATRQAARLGLQQPATALGIGEIAAQLGDSTLAADAFATAIATIPSLAADPWWLADPERAARFPGLVSRALEIAPVGDRWQIALMAGDPAGARALAADAAVTGSGAEPADVIQAWEGDDAALQRVLNACDARPLDDVALGWAARLERRRGKATAADHYMRWASIGNSTAAEYGSEVRISTHALVGRTITGGAPSFYGTYTYRRPTPWNPLVPSIVQLTLE